MTTDVLPEALRLAALLASGKQLSFIHHADAAAELRRLHAANLDCMAWYLAIKAERDKLLDLMKLFVTYETEMGEDNHVGAMLAYGKFSEAARAAIAKATGE